MSDTVLDAAGFEALARREVPYAGLLDFIVETLDPQAVRVRLPWRELVVRPGGSVCGPALMALADIALWGLVMARYGRRELAVTTDLDFRFLAKARGSDVLAEARPLRAGRTLLVGEVTMATAANPDRPVAFAVGTYILPPTDRPPEDRAARPPRADSF